MIKSPGNEQSDILQVLSRVGGIKIVMVSRKISRAKLYKINLKHPLVNMLREYETKVSLQIAEEEAEKMKSQFL
ncbi:TPA: hypothetical protein EYP75_00290 [Candidatus Bathyarchaeota archaeon]|nr:hypothetical protein [Candidatus Bathyarchaeota archaeon]